MRTIKFRGIWFEDGSWVYGNYVSKDQHVRSCIDGHVTHVEHYDYIVNQDEIDNLKYHQVHPDTVCQFTGFLDKNGKEIYEGDVLRSDEYPYSCIGDKARDNYYAVVYYCEEGACFGTVTVKNPNSSVAGISDGILDDVEREKMKSFEVIGNIHEEKWQQYGEYFKTEEEKEADND